MIGFIDKLLIDYYFRFAREAPEGAYALPVCYMGAPTVIAELLYASVEVETALHAMKELYACGGYQDGKLQNTGEYKLSYRSLYNIYSNTVMFIIPIQKNVFGRR